MAFVAAAIPLITAAIGAYQQSQQKGAASREASNAAQLSKGGSFGYNPTAEKSGQSLAEALGAGKPDRFSGPVDRPQMASSQVGSGMGAAPEAGASSARLKETLAAEGSPGPSAVEGLDDGPAKFAAMNQPSMGAGPQQNAGGASWLNADTVNAAAGIAGALAGGGGSPPSGGVPSLGNTNYTPTAIRLSEALGASRSPQRF